jgi:hypothetical protein
LTDTGTSEGWLEPDDITGADFQAIIEQCGLSASGQSGGVFDLYNIGGVAYWMLTAQPLFASAKPVELIIDHVKTVPRPPSESSEIAIRPRAAGERLR